MKTTFKLIGALVLVLSLGSCDKDDFFYNDDFFKYGVTKSYSSEVVLQWNELLSQSIDNSLPQPAEVKVYAMVTLAMHDALNNVVPEYETYALNNLDVDARDITKKNVHAVADAAVSQAARDMLVQLYPAATANADALLNSTLSDIEDANLKARGVDIGKDAAAAVLNKRRNDFPLGFVSYSGGTTPGEYQANYEPWVSRPPLPPNAVYAPNLGSLTPFGIESGDQFRDEAPYALNSEEYLADYNEVKTLGCMNCPLRTDEQTQIGSFWVETPSSSMNRMARALVVQRKLDGWEATRLIGLIHMSLIDAFIASFDGKYHFDFWRPITAIRAGDSDGVDATIGDDTWAPTFPTRPTPPTPAFPSSHAYAGGAAAAVFESYFKSDRLDLSLTSPYALPGVERHFSSFSQMAQENAISTIYLGHDFRKSAEVGLKQGRELGNYVYENNLRKL